MGLINSTDTRRISFDNSFGFNNTALAVAKAFDDDIMDFNNIAPEPTGELIFPVASKHMVEKNEDVALDYWSQRVDKLKKEHHIINSIIETEYNKEIDETNKTFGLPPKITHEKLQKIKPTFDWRTKIMQCYEENPHQPLVCSTIVQAFRNCVATCKAEE